jgi:SAM-dependent methyltransferase
MYRVKKRVLTREMKAIGPDLQDKEVLDVGVGTGFCFDNWKENGVDKMTGVDITNISIEKLRGKYPDHPFYRLDIGGGLNELAGRTYDAISALDVLYHIVDDVRFAKAITNLYSLLKPGGVLIFSDVFIHGSTVRTEHFVWRPLETTEFVLEEAGFELVKRVPLLFLMNDPIDTKSRFLKANWRALVSVASKNELSGFLFGMVLYPFENICVSLFKESPTTELLICRKPK